jgi:hypothetical protein
MEPFRSLRGLEGRTGGANAGGGNGGPGAIMAAAAGLENNNHSHNLLRDEDDHSSENVTSGGSASQGGSAGGPNWSSERRQQIIQQLLNKRKQMNQDGTDGGSNQQMIPQPFVNSSADDGNWSSSNNYSHQQQQYAGGSDPRYGDSAPLQYGPDSYYPGGDSQEQLSPPMVPRTAWAGMPPSSVSGSISGDTPSSTAVRTRERSHSASRSVTRMDSFASLGLGNLPPRAADDSGVGDSRAHRIAQAEAAIKAEMFKECTFKPRINSNYKFHNQLTSADDSTTPFYDRATRWQMNKEAEDLKRKATIERTKTADCTFRPKINKNSVKAVKEIRGEDGDVSTRLYKGGEEIAALKAKFIEDELRKNQEAEARLCTFQPQCATDKTRYNYIGAKFNMPPSNRPTEYERQDDKEYTFTPKVGVV